MLIEFKFKNFRSFRDEAVLSLEATGLGAMKKSLIIHGTQKLLPSVAIYGKNGGGKSNVIRAFWLAVQFIRNAQRTQHEKALIPVKPFMLDDDSQTKVASFEFTYILDGIKYNYGFSATKTEVEEEHLYYAPNGQKALVFLRDHQKFVFRENAEKAKRVLISKTVASNQLYFSIACTMNEEACTKAMRWFREYVFFSRDYEDMPRQLLESYEDPNMLRAITDYAKTADIGIQDMTYEIRNTDVTDPDHLPNELPEEMKRALSDFLKTLGDTSPGVESKLQLGEVSATSYHKGVGTDGAEKMYPLQLSDESDGTRKLMALAPGIERVLKCGGVMLVDELEKEMHPLLMEMIVAKFQSPTTNKNQAQLIFTTHNTELLDMEFLRKDQLYFVDKDRRTGASELYSISEFSTPTNENVRKGYLLGKYGGTPDIEVEEVE